VVNKLIEYSFISESERIGMLVVAHPFDQSIGLKSQFEGQAYLTGGGTNQLLNSGEAVKLQTRNGHLTFENVKFHDFKLNINNEICMGHMKLETFGINISPNLPSDT